MAERRLRFEPLERRELLASVLPWHNGTRPRDVDNDGQHAAIDALRVINYLNADHPTAVPFGAATGTPFAFIDTDGDGNVSAIDALLVFNALNAGLPAPQTAFMLPQSTVREGDFFVLNVTAPFLNNPLDLQLRHNGFSVYAYDIPELTGDGDVRLVLPDVLPNDKDTDDFHLFVRNFNEQASFPITVLKGLRMTIDSDNDAQFIREGDELVFHVRNGIGRSEVVAELLNGNQVVQRNTYETNEFGAIESKDGRFRIDRHLFLYDTREDGFRFRVSQAGKSVEERFTIHHGLQVWTSFKNIREGHELLIGCRGAVIATAVSVTLRFDANNSRLLNDTRQTSDDGECGTGGTGMKYTVPTDVVGSVENGATLEVRIGSGVDRVPETFEFQITVYPEHKEAPPSERPPPGNINLPSRTPAISFIALARRAAEGASDSDLRSFVPSGTATDPKFLSLVRAYARDQGDGPAKTSWMNQGIPAASTWEALSQPLTDALWTTIKDTFVDVFSSKDSMPFAQVTTNTLVVLLYGQGQSSGHVDEHGSLPGMDVVASQLNLDHVLQLPSGTIQNLGTAAKSTAKAMISQYIDDHAISSVIFAGYSWGGGLAQELAGWLTNKCTGACNRQVELTGVALIDAVDHGGIAEENAFPEGAKAIANWYQNPAPFDEREFLLNGGPIKNRGLRPYTTRYLGAILELCVDEGNPSAYDHFDIDNRLALVVAHWITRLIEERRTS